MMDFSTATVTPAGCVGVSRAVRRLVSGVLQAQLVLAATGVAWGWNIPPAKVESGKAEDEKHAQLSTDTYQGSAHGYIIEHAIEILDADQNRNWAAGALQFHQELIDGSRFPDRSGGDVNILVNLWTTIPFPLKVKTWKYRLCNSGSMLHYYNPDTGKGLQLEYWNRLESEMKKNAVVLSAFAVGIVGLDGLLFTTVGVDPELKQEYTSGVTLCEASFQSALEAWRGEIEPEEGRTYEETAMYHLGNACHYLSDLSLVDHTYDCFAGNHDGFETAGENLGDTTGYHASSGGIYNTKLSSSDFASQHAAELAGKVHNETMFQLVEGEGASTQPGADLGRMINGCGATDYDAAYKTAIPLAERYTAGLIARFFAEVSIPKNTPALGGFVHDTSKQPVPGAYIFYRASSKDRWNYVRADQQGKYTLSVPVKQIELRPAMPGYSFQGNYTRTGQGTGESFYLGKSPVTYSRPTFSTTAESVNFILAPLPVEAVALDLSTLTLAGEGPATAVSVTATDIRSRLDLIRPRALAVKAVLEPKTKLTLSNRTVSKELSQNVCDGLLQVCSTSSLTLAAEGASLGIAAYSDVAVKVYHYVDLNTGAVVLTNAQLVKAVDIGEKRLVEGHFEAKQGGGTEPDVALLQGLKTLEDSLPLTELVGRDGKSMSVVAVPRYGQGGLHDTALAHGLVLVPTPAGAELEVRIMPSAGSLGSGLASSLKLTTDSEGKAYFRILPGTHAGKLRIGIAVTKDSKVSYDSPATYLDLLVYPRPEKDVSPRKHPTLVSLMPVLVTALPIPTLKVQVAQAQPDRSRNLMDAQPLTMATDTHRGEPGIFLQVVTLDERRVWRTVPGAQILVNSGPRRILSGETDPAGCYGLHLEAGSYQVEVSKPGLPPARLDVDVDATRPEVLIAGPGREAIRAAADVHHRVVLGELRFEPPRPAPMLRERQGEPQPEPPQWERRPEPPPPEQPPERPPEPPQWERRPEPPPDRPPEPTPMEQPPRDRPPMPPPERPPEPPRPPEEPPHERPATPPPEQPPSRDREPLPQPVPPRDAPNSSPGQTQVRLDIRIIENMPRGFTPPLPGAQVLVARDGTTIARGQADASGHLSFQLPAGNYVISATKDGYQSGQKKVTVGAQNLSVEMALSRTSQ